MKDLKTRVYVKRLVAMAKEGDVVSEERVRGIVDTLKEKSFRNGRKILELFLARVKAEMRKEEAHIEFAGKLDEATLSSLQSNLNTYYSRELRVSTQENAELLSGVRIRVGDDVWDASAQGRLSRLKEQF